MSKKEVKKKRALKERARQLLNSREGRDRYEDIPSEEMEKETLTKEIEAIRKSKSNKPKRKITFKEVLCKIGVVWFMMLIFLDLLCLIGLAAFPFPVSTKIGLLIAYSPYWLGLGLVDIFLVKVLLTLIHKIKGEPVPTSKEIFRNILISFGLKRFIKN